MHWRPKNGKENKNENKVEKKKWDGTRYCFWWWWLPLLFTHTR